MADDIVRPPARATLFLSYARPDRARAERLITALEKHGYELWWDARLEGGSAFADSISDALKKADAVLVLWSGNSIASDWVRDEASVGRDRKRLVPLSLDGVEPPLGFRQYHAIDVSQWHGRSDCPETRAIDRAVELILRGQPLPDRPATERVSRRTLLIAGSGVGALAVGGGATFAWRQGWLGGSEVDNSIAVLPFKNLGGDPAQAYLSDGITEEIRSALKRIPALRVLASTSSGLAAEDGGGAKTIARKLGVAFLLEGSVQRAGDMLRIAADLTDGHTGFSKWSNQLDRPMADIFAVQREIAQTVASAMAAQIATADPEVGGTDNVAAYENYLRGREKYFNSSGEADDRAALALFDLAVAADPKFAKAHALRSRNLMWLGATLDSPAEAKSFTNQGIKAAQHAVELAPRLAEAQLAVGNALALRLDIRGAIPFLERAVTLAPGDAEILRTYALNVTYLGEMNAAREAATKAVSLDPLNHRTHRTLGDIEYFSNRYRAAIGHLEKAVSLNPSAGISHFRLACCHLLLGEVEQALKAAEKETTDYLRQVALAVIRRKLGDEAGAQKEFQALVKTGDSVTYQQAEVLAQWGQKDAAIQTLQHAVKVRDAGLLSALNDPLLVPLHGDPRYTAVLKQMKLI